MENIMVGYIKSTADSLLEGEKNIEARGKEVGP